MGVRHQDDVFKDALKSNLIRTRNGESLLVDGLIDEFVDDTLRNTLWLAHELFLKEDLLPIHCITSFFSVEDLIGTLILYFHTIRALASSRSFRNLQLKVICLDDIDGLLLIFELAG